MDELEVYLQKSQAVLDALPTLDELLKDVPTLEDRLAALPETSWCIPKGRITPAEASTGGRVLKHGL